MLTDDMPIKVFNYLKGLAPSSFMLTGGRSAAFMYKSWAASSECIKLISKMECYFGDERCVMPDHADSNYFLAMSTLFPKGMPEDFIVHRMQAENFDLDMAAANYSALLLKPMDLLLLTVGDDGHIASLFPFSSAIREKERLVVPVMAPQSPFQRLTITPKVIENAREVIVFAGTSQKRDIYRRALEDPDDIESIPARLVLNRTWVFD
uniref:6-phosphogluconolactonase n=1 Tax=Polynucleobacter sp. TaxID=2029855 RepID=UPI0040470DF8